MAAKDELGRRGEAIAERASRRARADGPRPQLAMPAGRDRPRAASTATRPVFVEVKTRSERRLRASARGDHGGEAGPAAAARGGVVRRASGHAARAIRIDAVARASRRATGAGDRRASARGLLMPSARTHGRRPARHRRAVVEIEADISARLPRVRADRAARCRARRGAGPRAGAAANAGMPAAGTQADGQPVAGVAAQARARHSTSASRWPASPQTAGVAPSRSSGSCTSASSGSTAGCAGRRRPAGRARRGARRLRHGHGARPATPTRRALVPGVRWSAVASLREAAICHGAELEPIDRSSRSCRSRSIGCRRRPGRPRRRDRQPGCRRGDAGRRGGRAPRLPARPARCRQDHARLAAARAPARPRARRRRSR